MFIGADFDFRSGATLEEYFWDRLQPKPNVQVDQQYAFGPSTDQKIQEGLKEGNWISGLVEPMSFEVFDLDSPIPLGTPQSQMPQTDSQEDTPPSEIVNTNNKRFHQVLEPAPAKRAKRVRFCTTCGVGLKSLKSRAGPLNTHFCLNHGAPYHYCIQKLKELKAEHLIERVNQHYIRYNKPSDQMSDEELKKISPFYSLKIINKGGSPILMPKYPLFCTWCGISAKEGMQKWHVGPEGNDLCEEDAKTYRLMLSTKNRKISRKQIKKDFGPRFNKPASLMTETEFQDIRKLPAYINQPVWTLPK